MKDLVLVRMFECNDRTGHSFMAVDNEGNHYPFFSNPHLSRGDSLNGFGTMSDTGVESIDPDSIKEIEL